MSEWLAGANVLGSVLGAFGQGGANAANASMAREAWNNNLYAMMENQRFQERMSSTAYQRAMNDMRYAGLNPILAYSQGGATTPGGMGASMQAATMQNELGGLGDGISSAAQAAKDWEAKDLVKEQAKNTQSQTELNKATEGLAKQNEATSAAQQKKAEEEAENVRLSRPLIGAQTSAAAASAAQAAANARHTNLQADDFTARGDSVVGRNLGSVFRMLETVRKDPYVRRDFAESVRALKGAADIAKDRLRDPPTSAKQNSEVPPTTPKTLRELRPEWFK